MYKIQIYIKINAYQFMPDLSDSFQQGLPYKIYFCMHIKTKYRVSVGRARLTGALLLVFTTKVDQAHTLDVQHAPCMSLPFCACASLSECV